nr:MAG TPA: hypothetical protein [Caudoviricetes sp.]
MPAFRPHTDGKVSNLCGLYCYTLFPYKFNFALLISRTVISLPKESYFMYL